MLADNKADAIRNHDLAFPNELSQAGDHYLDLLAAWNDRVDLVAPADRQVWHTRHLLDSYALARLLPPHGSLIDIGSGAGFPGLVIAIAHDAMRVTLVEPRGKRVAFLRTVVRELNLANVTVLCERVEDVLAQPSFQAKFDHVTSRATFQYQQWLEKGAGLMTDDADARIWAMLGPTDPPGLGTCEKDNGLEIKHIESFNLPDSSMRRIIALGRII